MSEHAKHRLKNGVPQSLVNAGEALSSARRRLEFLITTLKREDEDDLTLSWGDVQGLVAILEDMKKALVMPENHLHDLTCDVIHGRTRPKAAEVQ